MPDQVAYLATSAITQPLSEIAWESQLTAATAKDRRQVGGRNRPGFTIPCQAMQN